MLKKLFHQQKEGIKYKKKYEELIKNNIGYYLLTHDKEMDPLITKIEDYDIIQGRIKNIQITVCDLDKDEKTLVTFKTKNDIYSLIYLLKFQKPKERFQKLKKQLSILNFML